MDVYTSSRGIASNPQIRRLLKTNKVRLLSFLSAKFISNKHSVFVGWGMKPNTQVARGKAKQLGVDYWALEDGFISWLHHPSQSKPFQRLSYIVDKVGIYYDASKPSGLDAIIDAQTSIDEARVNRLRDQLLKLKISKYNQSRGNEPQWPAWLKSFKDQKTPFILLVDQTFNDASIEYSGGSHDSFKLMFDWCVSKLQANQSLQAVIKIHPDVLLGKKKGYLLDLVQSLDLPIELKARIHFLTEDILPCDLIEMSSEVATVSSQLGFEALWQNKPVHCFAWPFYAGRGLTQDKCNGELVYKRKQVSLNELLDAALIQYPTYLHPDTQMVCEVEEIVNYLQSHFMSRHLFVSELSVPNVSLWKRSFIPEFVSASARKIQFSEATKGSAKLLWGMKPYSSNKQYLDDLVNSKDSTIWRMEDGFIRSVGLGADLRRPSSLVLDDLGIYYNGKQASRLETLLNSYDFNAYEKDRANKLLGILKSSNITKYNVEKKTNVSALLEDANGKAIILVAGQFQQDLSMTFGADDIQDNLSLLKQVRLDYPQAYIIYKEHPDVYSGVRPGKLEKEDVLLYADQYVTDTSLTDLFGIIDRLCTICSLSGFEALLRGISVSTYGLPFYAGWGLTQDRYAFPRRQRQLNIEELIYITLVLYSRYVNWGTRQLTTVESTISSLVCERTQDIQLKTNWFARQYRKIRYLSQAIFKIDSKANFGSRS